MVKTANLGKILKMSNCAYYKKSWIKDMAAMTVRMEAWRNSLGYQAKDPRWGVHIPDPTTWFSLQPDGIYSTSSGYDPTGITAPPRGISLSTTVPPYQFRLTHPKMRLHKNRSFSTTQSATGLYYASARPNCHNYHSPSSKHGQTDRWDSRRETKWALQSPSPPIWMDTVAFQPITSLAIYRGAGRACMAHLQWGTHYYIAPRATTRGSGIYVVRKPFRRLHDSWQAIEQEVL